MKVVVKILGNPAINEHDADTVGGLKASLGLTGYSANVNGAAQTDDFALSEGQLVTFAPSVKGGLK